jgi:hypothetical protein
MSGSETTAAFIFRVDDKDGGSNASRTLAQ